MFNIIFLIIILFNYSVINFSVFIGTRFEYVSFFFQEREVVTFVSAVQLALTSCLAICVYAIGKVLYKKNASHLKEMKVWLVSALVFGFCALDEYFMMHEGIDGGIATIFLGKTDNPHLDGLTLAVYLVIALFVFLKFRKEILKHKRAFGLFCMGGFLFLLSIILDIKSINSFRIILEESAKLMAVAFFFLGHISVLSDYLEMLEKRLKKK